MPVECRLFPDSTRTAAEAAAAIGCEVGDIAKSLVFRTESGGVVLVIASGSDRVDERRLSELVGEPVERPDARFVRDQTGFVIGGVAPVGLACEANVFIDEALVSRGTVWASAGTPHSVFRIEASALGDLSGGRVVDVAR